MKLRTVVILLIIIALCGIAYLGIRNNNGVELFAKTNMEDLNTDLLQVQAKVKVINEQSVVNDDEALLKGEKVQDSQNEEVISIANSLKEKEIIKEDEENFDKYYVWNKALLEELGLTNVKSDILVVNYATSEVILPDGIQLEENGDTLYKFSDIQSKI